MAHQIANSRYTELLQQIAGLQENLSKTTAICHTLKSQNETLMQSHEQLRNENARLTEVVQESEVNYVRMQQAKAEGDKKAENALRDLRAQFEKQSVDFANVQADLARRGPQDLQIIRMQILEELSSKFRGKVATAEADVEKFRDLYFKHKRAHDLLLDEKKHLEEAHRRKVAGLEKSHKAALDRVSQSMQDLRATTKSTHPVSGQVINLERKISELEVVRRELSQELQDLRKEKEDVVVAMNASALLTARQLSELKGELLKAQCELEQSQSKHDAQAASINALQQRLEETRLRLSDTDQKLESQTMLCDQLTQENTHLKDDHSAMLVQVESQYEQRIRAADAKLKEERLAAERVTMQKNKEIEDLNRAVSRLRHEQERAMQSINSRMQQLQSSKSVVERHLRETQEEVKVLNQNGQKVLEAAHAKIDAAAASAEEAGRAKAVAEEQAATRSVELRELRSKLATLEGNFKAMDEEYGKAKLELQSVAAAKKRLEAEVEQLRNTEVERSNTRQRMHSELAQEKQLLGLQLKKEKAALKSEIERAQKRVADADAGTAAMKARCQRALAKAKDKYNRLKAKFETESNTRAVAEEAVERLRDEYKKLQNSSDLRVQQLLMQLRAIEKDKDADFNSLALASLGERLGSPHKDLFQQLKAHSNELAALSVT